MKSNLFESFLPVRACGNAEEFVIGKIVFAGGKSIYGD